MMDFSRLSGTTALVTGASGGIGAEFATRLAERGADLVLVARSGDKLKALASSLRQQYGARVLTEKVDLSEPDASRYLFEQTVAHGVDVNFLVNNAGAGVVGQAAEADVESIAAMLNLNAHAAVDSTLRFLPGMVSRGRGAVVNVTSMAAFQPMPFMAAYAASKVMLQSFTVAVGAEVAGAGVRVLALCPGVTATGMKSEEVLPSLGGIRTPEQVVATAFRALNTRKPSVVDGRRNALLARSGRYLPERVVLVLGRRFTRAVAAEAVAIRPVPTAVTPLT